MSNLDERFIATEKFITNAKFRSTKVREGYGIEGVDDFLDRLSQTLSRRDQAELTDVPEAISNAKFAVTTLRAGYDMMDVDDFLDELSARVKALTSPGSNISTVPGQLTDRISPAQPFDGAFFAAVKFSEGRFLVGYNKGEVDDFVAHVKEIVWRNDANEIHELSFEPQPKKFSHTSLFTKGYSISNVDGFTKEVSAKAATY